ncbi:LysR family transcriptional regulator [Paenibacillus pinistramenti]|uniref:LysR family transcriptional regulator n=1 Tax=Paenibacillus pinistramenti TaxID=1768003 RepID=UPI001108FFD9|nr:LysR family transcriptional regulator [Paenibacillus pinistramenti]
MEIEQLNYFLMVAQYRHFTLAAEQLCISQSALSKHIRALESELGVSLFDRCGRSVHVTSAGQDFLVFAKEVVASYNKLRTSLNQYKDVNEGSITIGMIPEMSQYGLHTVLLSFIKKHSDIHLEVLEEKADKLLELMSESQIDFAFVRTSVLPDNNYKIVPLLEDVMVLAVHKDHPLAGKKEIDPSDLEHEYIITPDSDSGLPTLAVQSFSQTGTQPKLLLNNVNAQTALSFVAEKLGVSLMMRRGAECFKSGEIAIIPLKEQMRSSIAIVFPHGRKLSPSAAVLREYTVKWFSKKNRGL